MKRLDQNEIIRQFREEGYKEVYLRKDKAYKKYEKHSHDYNTKLSILEGDILIRTKGREIKLTAGSSILIGRNEVHEAKVGPSGCRYVVGEDDS